MVWPSTLVLNNGKLSAARPGIAGFPQFETKIKRVIFLCQAGGPSHLELFDHKPALEKRDGEAMPKSFTKGQQIAQLQGRELKVLAPQHPFERYGRSGQHMSSLLPHLGEIADDICIIRSMQTEQINHDTAHTFMNSGSRLPGLPSMGSWITYGLGSDSEDLPGFVVLTSERRRAVTAHRRAPVAQRLLTRTLPRGQVQFLGRPGFLRALPKGVSDESQSQLIDAVARPQSHPSRLPSTIPTSRHASHSTSWPSACR